MKNLALRPVSMSSLEIAELTGKQHFHVIRDIEKMFSDADEENAQSKFGGGYKDANNQKRKCYYLNFDWTLTLITGYNVKLRRAIIARWQALEDDLNQRKEKALARRRSSDPYLEQSAVIDSVRREDGKEVKPYHFSNEADMINRIIFGMSSKKYREHHEFEKTTNLRDVLLKEELDAIADLQSINISLIKIGMSFQERKKALNDRFMKKHNDGLVLLYSQNFGI